MQQQGAICICYTFPEIYKPLSNRGWAFDFPMLLICIFATTEVTVATEQELISPIQANNLQAHADE